MGQFEAFRPIVFEVLVAMEFRRFSLITGPLAMNKPLP
jgi:hypothetical protein